MLSFKQWGIRAIALALLLFSLLLPTCGKEDPSDNETTAPVADTSPHGVSYYDNMEDLSSFLTLGSYKGLTVTPKEGQTKEDAVWEAVIANATRVAVPTEEVDYYFASLCAQYRYYASLKDMEYSELLSSLGISEASLRSDAYQMARKDLLFVAVLRDSKISLTDTEKNSLFPKYMDKFVSDYGYSADDVATDLRELIYETMLYDKVTEYLLANNTVTD